LQYLRLFINIIPDENARFQGHRFHRRAQAKIFAWLNIASSPFLICVYLQIFSFYATFVVWSEKETTKRLGAIDEKRERETERKKYLIQIINPRIYK